MCTQTIKAIQKANGARLQQNGEITTELYCACVKAALLIDKVCLFDLTFLSSAPSTCGLALADCFLISTLSDNMCVLANIWLGLQQCKPLRRVNGHHCPFQFWNGQ